MGPSISLALISTSIIGIIGYFRIFKPFSNDNYGNQHSLFQVSAVKTKPSNLNSRLQVCWQGDSLKSQFYQRPTWGKGYIEGDCIREYTCCHYKCRHTFGATAMADGATARNAEKTLWNCECKYGRANPRDSTSNHQDYTTSCSNKCIDKTSLKPAFFRDPKAPQPVSDCITKYTCCETVNFASRTGRLTGAVTTNDMKTEWNCHFSGGSDYPCSM